MYAYETGMPAEYEWKNYPKCFSLWKYSSLDLGNGLWEKNQTDLNETAPLPDRTGKQSLLHVIT
jgi:hypothetical protein